MGRNRVVSLDTPVGDPDTAPRSNTDSSAGHFRPCPSVVYGVQKKKHAEGWGCSPKGMETLLSLHLPPQCVIGGTHDSVTTALLPSQVKYIYTHPRWLYIAARVIVLLSNTFCYIVLILSFMFTFNPQKSLI